MEEEEEDEEEVKTPTAYKYAPQSSYHSRHRSDSDASSRVGVLSFADSRGNLPNSYRSHYREGSDASSRDDAAPFVEGLIPIRARDTDAHYVPHNTGTVTRSGTAWSGEWNQQRMEDVISKLRNLK